MDMYMTLTIVPLALWLVWALVALSRKAFVVFAVLAVTGALWGWFAFTAYSPIFMGPLLIVAAVALGSTVRIVKEYERGVLLRLGRLKALMGPGFNLVIPFGVDTVRKVDLRTLTIDVPKQEIITKDNVPALVDAVVYFNVFDPILAVTKVFDYVKSTSLLAQTILRSVLGGHDLDELLAKRNELNAVLKDLLDVATDPWGIKVTAVEVKAIEIPETMKRAMARQAEAERERRAKIIAADGEFQASEQLAKAAAVIATQPNAIQLRQLQTLAEIAIEKNSTIVFPLPMEIMRWFDSQKGK